jgi:hypothetical protein
MPPAAHPIVQAIMLVEDLSTTRRQLEGLGFAVSDGGRHPGRGTANLIVPFGQQYLELLAIVDEAEALDTPQGRSVADAFSRHGPGLARWSVEASDIRSISERLGYPVEQRQRDRPDGRVITWESVGVDESWAEPWRCAFMAWDDPDLHPARTVSAHANGATGFDELEVVVPETDTIVDWIGGALPSGLVVYEGADAGPRALTIASPSGSISVA